MKNMVGTIQHMTVSGVTGTGYMLENNFGRVHLDREESLAELEAGDSTEVFIYPEKSGKLRASGKLPEASLETYGWSEVAGTVKGLGAFVDIGTTTEILVSADDLPLFEQVWPKSGDKLFVKLETDRKNRLLAIPASENVIDDIREWAPDQLYGQTVKGRVYRTSKEGTAIITDEDYRGFIHHQERKEEPRLGELVEGRVIDVKEDGTLNLSLRPLKQYSMGDDAEQILEYLQGKGGRMPFTDKSDPEDIRTTFQISKAAFKRALGKLMKEKKIIQEDGWTSIADNDEK
ncbi:S1-like domain-containing RNA-binding protein [Aciduricibacillus chroicocephali]|uniref:S1-like domain-containing RNA-binding protein n=1 Tax=Aciduricibacillus chroicocephali TaxID=3054939 RepID=A0ABY9KT93_9BACI|nr:S1-like domain-containing RNA-binding protein [Bacillaceae bacterium 44XB]